MPLVETHETPYDGRGLMLWSDSELLCRFTALARPSSARSICTAHAFHVQCPCRLLSAPYQHPVWPAHRSGRPQRPSFIRKCIRRRRRSPAAWRDGRSGGHRRALRSADPTLCCLPSCKARRFIPGAHQVRSPSRRRVNCADYGVFSGNPTVELDFAHALSRVLPRTESRGFRIRARTPPCVFAI